MRKLFLLWLVAVLTEFGISAMPKVEHKEKNPEPRVVGVDQAHWWVKVNRMSREGKPAEEIVDFINEESKQQHRLSRHARPERVPPSARGRIRPEGVKKS